MTDLWPVILPRKTSPLVISPPIFSQPEISQSEIFGPRNFLPRRTFGREEFIPRIIFDAPAFLPLKFYPWVYNFTRYKMIQIHGDFVNKGILCIKCAGFLHLADTMKFFYVKISLLKILVSKASKWHEFVSS